MKYILGLLLCLLSWPVAAAPWVVYGQTSVVGAGANVNNPTPNVNGLNGEVTSLPYTVPVGKTLTISVVAMESYNATGTCSLIVYIGNSFANGKIIALASASHGTRQTIGTWVIPGGTQISAILINNEAATQVFGWGITGTLN
jgi:hypothetical protein